MEKHIDNLFNEEMTSNEARSVFFKALEGKSEEEIEQIKIAYSKIIPKIIEKEMRHNATCQNTGAAFCFTEHFA